MRITPLRLMTLQYSQRGFTDGRTFISTSIILRAMYLDPNAYQKYCIALRAPSNELSNQLFIAIRDTTSCQIVWRELNQDTITF